ncbi:MAG: hypothetical protein MJ137_08505 [Clostridia bacterium]|nr:hypothetical protein [Clostridia bacterium]
MKSFVKKSFFRTFACYTVLTSVFTVIMMLGNGAGSGISALRTFLFLPFSLIFGFAQTLLTDGSMNKAGAMAIHALLLIPGTYFCIFLPVDIENEASGASKFLHFCLVFLVYIIVSVILYLFAGKLKRTMEEDRKYRK